MDAIIFHRPTEMEADELAAAKPYFPTTHTRLGVKSGQLVIGRYSMLPFYPEVELDLRMLGARPINDYGQHRYAADLGAHVPDLGSWAPRTWGTLAEVPKDAGPFVLKGETNSLKNLWTTHMYAETWKDAVDVYRRLTQDSLIGTQHIYIRKHVPLVKLWTNLSEMPITLEFRFFVYKQKVMSGGFYWDLYKEDLEIYGGIKSPSVDSVPPGVLNAVVARVGDKIPFYAVDLALDTDGRWWVVDLNDGQQAGLCGNDPHVLYSNLAAALAAEK